MSEITDRELAERHCPSDSHRPDKPGSYCECERILAALAEQGDELQQKHQEEIDLLIRAKAGEFERAEAAEAALESAIAASEDVDYAVRIDTERIAALDRIRELEADGRRLDWWHARPFAVLQVGGRWCAEHAKGKPLFHDPREAIDAAIAAEATE